MRALLDHVRENGASVQANLVNSRNLLLQATLSLQILDRELGEEELVKSVAAESARLAVLIAENSQRQ